MRTRRLAMSFILGVGLSGGLLGAAVPGVLASDAAAPRDVSVRPAQEGETELPEGGNGETEQTPEPQNPEPQIPAPSGNGSTATTGDDGGGISVAQATVIAAAITAGAAVLAAIIAAASRRS